MRRVAAQPNGPSSQEHGECPLTSSLHAVSLTFSLNRSLSRSPFIPPASLHPSLSPSLAPALPSLLHTSLLPYVPPHIRPLCSRRQSTQLHTIHPPALRSPALHSPSTPHHSLTTSYLLTSSSASTRLLLLSHGQGGTPSLIAPLHLDILELRRCSRTIRVLPVPRYPL